MNTPTFKEQFDKVTTAYFENKLKPLENCACFVGNILNNNGAWAKCREFLHTDKCTRIDYGNMEILVNEDYATGHITKNKEAYILTRKVLHTESSNFYTVWEVIKLERNFLTIWIEGGQNEHSLFDAMDSTLDLLRKIHESKGEVIESYEFKPRRCLTTS